MSTQSKADMQRHLKARDTIYQLSSHPALADPFFTLFGLITIDIEQVCKHGHIRPMKGCIQISNTPQNYKKYKKEFDKEFKEYTKEELDLEGKLIRADVPYEKVYGEPWAPDHVEYWGDLTFCVFLGKNFKNWHERSCWERYAGTTASGRSFEDMIIKLGRNFFKTYGKFTEEDFLTSEEKENHTKEKIFFFRPIKKRGRFKTSRLVRNRKYKRVETSEINRRWLKWYATTEDSKRWGSSIENTLSGKNPNGSNLK
jgi:hypothetical protein